MAKRSTAGLNDQKQSTCQEARRSAKGQWKILSSRVVKANDAMANDSGNLELKGFTRAFSCLPCTY